MTPGVAADQVTVLLHPEKQLFIFQDIFAQEKKGGMYVSFA